MKALLSTLPSRLRDVVMLWHWPLLVSLLHGLLFDAICYHRYLLDDWLKALRNVCR